MQDLQAMDLTPNERRGQLTVLPSPQTSLANSPGAESRLTEYAAAVLVIIITPLWSLTGRRRIDELMHEDAMIWAKTLSHHIPVTELAAAWRRTVANYTGTYQPSAFDVIAAHGLNVKDKAAAEEKRRQVDPVANCTHRNRHVTDDGQIMALNWFTDRDEPVPCPHCRPDDLRRWKADQIARYGEHKPKFDADGVVLDFVRRMAMR